MDYYPHHVHNRLIERPRRVSDNRTAAPEPQAGPVPLRLADVLGLRLPAGPGLLHLSRGAGMTRAQLSRVANVETVRLGLRSLWLITVANKHRRALRLEAQAKARKRHFK